MYCAIGNKHRQVKMFLEIIILQTQIHKQIGTLSEFIYSFCIEFPLHVVFYLPPMNTDTEFGGELICLAALILCLL